MKKIVFLVSKCWLVLVVGGRWVKQLFRRKPNVVVHQHIHINQTFVESKEPVTVQNQPTIESPLFTDKKFMFIFGLTTVVATAVAIYIAKSR